MFKTRLISGIVLVLIALATIISGGNILYATILIISLIGLSELYKVLEFERRLLGIAGYLFTILYFVLIYQTNGETIIVDYFSDLGVGGIVMLTIAFLMVLMAIYVFTFPTYKSEQIMLAFFGFVYVSFMLSYVYQTRMLPNGAFIVWLIFLCSWGCDTCAYCVGMLIGKHKLAPVLSPKKSIEGGIGGVAGAALLGVIYAVVLKQVAPQAEASIGYYALICGVGAIISQIGDLSASAIKRNHDVKDYGTLIPGHGGILDRFDSVIFTASMIYYLAVFFLR